MRVMGGHQPHAFAGIEYFARIDLCDAFVVSDDVKFNAKDWQNRNRIKAPFGTHSLVVPVTGADTVLLKDKELAKNARLDKMWKTIEQSYAGCPYWKDLEWLQGLMLSQPTRLVDLARPLIEFVVKYYGITTDIRWASELQETWPEDPSEKIAIQAEMLGCDTYAFGRGANAYLNPRPFADRGIELRAFVWTPPRYRQRWTKEKFEENLSILDLVANEGPGGIEILRKAIRLADGSWGTIETPPVLEEPL